MITIQLIGAVDAIRLRQNYATLFQHSFEVRQWHALRNCAAQIRLCALQDATLRHIATDWNYLTGWNGGR